MDRYSAMSVQVRVAFVEDGKPARIDAAAPAPGESLISWVSIPAIPIGLSLPAPPQPDEWNRTFIDLKRRRALYLAPGYGSDDDPGVAVLRVLANRGTISLTVGPEFAPAVEGPTVTGPAGMDWRPAPAIQTVVRGIAGEPELTAWRNRLAVAYGSTATIEVKPWTCSQWRADEVKSRLTFPTALRALPTEESKLRDTNNLRDIARRLRGPDGCPWDKQQTHQTLRPYLVEEAHEALSAIDLEDDAAMTDEFGDVLMNLVLHAEIARQRGGFDWPDVVAAISDKMIRRHPHVFGDAEFENLEALGKSWAQIKATEKDSQKGPLDSLPESLPSLAFASSAARTLRRAGTPLDSSNVSAKTMAALTSGQDPEALGDALLWVVARAEAAGIDLDMALRDANARLRERHSMSDSQTSSTRAELRRSD
jgi:MazG family protein